MAWRSWAAERRLGLGSVAGQLHTPLVLGELKVGLMPLARLRQGARLLSCRISGDVSRAANGLVCSHNLGNSRAFPFRRSAWPPLRKPSLTFCGGLTGGYASRMVQPYHHRPFFVSAVGTSQVAGMDQRQTNELQTVAAHVLPSVINMVFCVVKVSQ